MKLYHLRRPNEKYQNVWFSFSYEYDFADMKILSREKYFRPSVYEFRR